MSEDVFANSLARSDFAKRDGGASGISCPECQGNLWQLGEGTEVQYQCRVGHLLSPDSLVAEQAVAIEAMLWATQRPAGTRGAPAPPGPGGRRRRRPRGAALEGPRRRRRASGRACSPGVAGLHASAGLRPAIASRPLDNGFRIAGRSNGAITRAHPEVSPAVISHCRCPRPPDVQLCTPECAHGLGTVEDAAPRHGESCLGKAAARPTAVGFLERLRGVARQPAPGVPDRCRAVP